MATQKEREEFIVLLTCEGVPLDVARLVLRHAATYHRLQELECSSEAAYRDRIPCPARRAPANPREPLTVALRFPCLCGDYGSRDGDRHGTVPRYMLREFQIEQRLEKLLAPYKVTPVFSGDPCGATIKLKMPSGKTDDWSQTGLCVP